MRRRGEFTMADRQRWLTDPRHARRSTDAVTQYNRIELLLKLFYDTF